MKPLTPAKELRLLAREAQALWLSLRSHKGYDRFTDKRAMANLRISAQRATRWGEWRDIECAIREHAFAPEANPYYLDEWTRNAYSARNEAARLEHKMREKEGIRRPRHISEIVAGVGKPCPGWKPLIRDGDVLRCGNCGVNHRAHP